MKCHESRCIHNTREQMESREKKLSFTQYCITKIIKSIKAKTTVYGHTSKFKQYNKKIFLAVLLNNTEKQSYKLKSKQKVNVFNPVLDIQLFCFNL